MHQAAPKGVISYNESRDAQNQGRTNVGPEIFLYPASNRCDMAEILLIFMSGSSH